MLGSWIACITGCLCFGCVYNWLPVLALPVQPQQPVIQAIQPSTGNQLYRQPKHRQPVIQAAQAQATSYTGSASTGNQLYTQRKHRQRKHRQPVIQAAQAQATRYLKTFCGNNCVFKNCVCVNGLAQIVVLIFCVMIPDWFSARKT